MDTYIDPATASSGHLWAEYERLRAESNEALSSGDMDTYWRIDKQESAITGEIDARFAAGTSLDGKTSKAVPADAGKVIAARKRELAAAKAEAARIGDVSPPRPGAPSVPGGKTPAEIEADYKRSVEAKLEVGAISKEIETLQQRTQFFDLTDDQLSDKLEDARIAIEAHKTEAAKFKAENRPRAAAKAERLAAEIDAASMSLYREGEHRRADKDHEKVIEVMSRERALKAREDALRHWQKVVEEREEIGRRYRNGETEGLPRDAASLNPLLEAERNLKAIRDMQATNPKPTEAEVALQREIIAEEAPRRRGSWSR